MTKDKQVEEDTHLRLTSTDPQDIQKVLNGINKLADIMEVTLGTYGRNVLIQKTAKAMTTKDGVTVARFAITEDVHENLGMALLREISLATNFEVGDGTTTSALIAREIINKASGIDENPVILAENIKKESTALLKNISILKKEIKTNDDIRHIATISSGREDIGRLIAEIYQEKGMEANIIVQKSLDEETKIEHVQGLKVDSTYIDSAFVNAPKNKAILENVPVLIINKDNVVTQEFIQVIDEIVKSTKRPDIAIFAKNLSDDVLKFLLANKQEKKLNPVVIRISREIEDVALVTGCSAINDKSTITLQNFKLSNLGFAKKIVCNNKYTTILGDPRVKLTVDNTIERLKVQKEDNVISSQDNLRLSNLAGGISILKLGKTTDMGWEELNYRTDDAIRATETAVKHGIIEGEMLGFIKACKDSPFFQSIFENIMKALFANAGANDAIVKHCIKNQVGYNFKTKEYSDDLFAEGIIDPVEVLRVCVRNGVNIATIFLTLGGVIIDAKVDQKA